MPVVVRDSTWATVYAFFSITEANRPASMSSMLVPCENARFAMLCVMRLTVSARCSSERAHPCSAISKYLQRILCGQMGVLLLQESEYSDLLLNALNYI